VLPPFAAVPPELRPASPVPAAPLARDSVSAPAPTVRVLLAAWTAGLPDLAAWTAALAASAGAVFPPARKSALAPPPTERALPAAWTARLPVLAASAGAVVPSVHESASAPTPDGCIPPAAWTPGLPVLAASETARTAALPVPVEGGVALCRSPAASVGLVRCHGAAV